MTLIAQTENVRLIKTDNLSVGYFKPEYFDSTFRGLSLDRASVKEIATLMGLPKEKLGTSGCVLTKEIELDGILLPAKTICVPAWDYGAITRAERLQSVSGIVHEIAHTRDEDEIAARLAERAYLRKNGLSGPTDKQIFLAVHFGRYSPKDKKAAEQLAFRWTFGSSLAQWRAWWVEVTQGFYSVEKELKTHHHGSNLVK